MSDRTTARPVLRIGARLATLIAIPCIIASLAACTAAAPGVDTKTPGAEQSFEDWQLAFSSCMRDEGVDLPDPGSDGSSEFTLDGIDPEAFETASASCQDRLGPPPAPAGGGASGSDDTDATRLQLAECLRDNGFDVPDPVAGEAFGIPADAPEDVLEACGVGSTTGSTPGVTSR